MGSTRCGCSDTGIQNYSYCYNDELDYEMEMLNNSGAHIHERMSGEALLDNSL